MANRYRFQYKQLVGRMIHEIVQGLCRDSFHVLEESLNYSDIKKYYRVDKNVGEYNLLGD